MSKVLKHFLLLETISNVIKQAGFVRGLLYLGPIKASLNKESLSFLVITKESNTHNISGIRHSFQSLFKIKINDWHCFENENLITAAIDGFLISFSVISSKSFDRKSNELEYGQNLNPIFRPFIIGPFFPETFAYCLSKATVLFEHDRIKSGADGWVDYFAKNYSYKLKEGILRFCKDSLSYKLVQFELSKPSSIEKAILLRDIGYELVRLAYAENSRYFPGFEYLSFNSIKELDSELSRRHFSIGHKCLTSGINDLDEIDLLNLKI